jgi:hypothetical protein
MSKMIVFVFICDPLRRWLALWYALIKIVSRGSVIPSAILKSVNHYKPSHFWTLSDCIWCNFCLVFKRWNNWCCINKKMECWKKAFINRVINWSLLRMTEPLGRMWTALCWYEVVQGAVCCWSLQYYVFHGNTAQCNNALSLSWRELGAACSC